MAMRWMLTCFLIFQLSPLQANAENCSDATVHLGARTGVLLSPNYPYPYGRGNDCSWIIYNPSSDMRAVALQFDSLETASCVDLLDYVEIRDGSLSSSPLLKKLCGIYTDKFRVVSTGTSMFVRLHIVEGRYRGFRAVYTMEVIPSFVRRKSTVNALKGSDIVLSCKCSANPVPNATWVNDKIDLSSGRYSISNAISGTNELATHFTIRNVSYYDMGDYKCRFWNIHGNKEDIVQLYVVEDCSKVVFDFEDGAASLKDWSRTGRAFNNEPRYGRPGQISNQGNYWIRGDDYEKGTLLSPEFLITGAKVSFLIGGSGHLFARLLVYGKRVLWSGPSNMERMSRKTWNVNDYVGERARIMLVDIDRRNHMNFDDFRGDVMMCGGCSQPLGMTNFRIPDFAITASSMLNQDNAPKYGRLFGLRNWTPKSKVIGEWLQVDLGTVVMVTKIAIQPVSMYWIEWYTVSYSEYGTDFQQYGKKVIPKYSTGIKIIENVLSPSIRGRFIRIYPTSWHIDHKFKLNIELYGCLPKQASPKIFGLPKLVTKLLGSTVSLSCLANGVPYSDYSWVRRDPSNSLTSTVSGPSLLLTHVTENECGVYTCVASNAVGNDSFDVRLNVHTYPSLIRGMIKTQIILTGKVTNLTCQGKGSPRPTIAWLRDVQKITKSSRVTLSSLASGDKLMTSELVITDTKFEDSGVYTCVIDNTAGRTNSIGTILVHGPPEFTLKPKKTTIVKGENANISCAATAVPIPQIRWKLNGKYLHDSVVTPNGTLMIKNAGNNQLYEGNYTCEASNSFGTKSSTAQLTIHVFPSVIRGMIILQIVTIGKVTNITCQGKGNPRPTIEWLKNGQKITKSNRVTLSSSASGDKLVISELVITDTKYEDSGVYTCVIDNTVGGTNSSGTLLVHGPPEFTLTPKDQTIVKGENANLYCAAAAIPTPQIRWKLNGKYLHGAKVTQNGTLMIKNTSNNQLYEENYTCEASNSFGIKLSTAQLTIYAFPSVIGGMIKSQVIITGEVTNLTCQGKGNPRPTIAWLKNGQKITTSSTVTITSSASGDKLVISELVITDTKFEDSGLYTCMIDNTIGGTNISRTLLVHGPPEFTLTPKNQTILKGENANLSCAATAVPTAKIRWKLNGKYVHDADVTHNGTLMIKNVANNKLYEGNYTCEASNSVGTKFSTAQLTIHGPPEFTLTPNNQTIVKGENAHLSCAATAVPTPEIRWKLNGEYLLDTDVTRNGTLVINNASNNQLYEGIYTCVASNSVGTKFSSARLTVHERPRIKTFPGRSMNVVQTHGAVLHCDAAGDPPPELEWRKDGVPLKATERILTQANKQILNLRHLRMEDSGLYKCVAWNSVGNVTTATNLNVFGEPQINKELTIKLVGSRLGNPTNVMCLVDNPLPVHYTWTKGGDEIHDSDSVKVHSNILVVTPRKPKDFGIYVCHVTNIAGKANYSIELVQQAEMNISYVAGDASKSDRESVGSDIVTFLIAPIIILLVAVVILACQHVQLKKKNTCSKRDRTGLVTYNTHKDEHLPRNNLVG